MEMSLNYILSQIFTIIMYALLGVTYQMKDRKKILFFSISSNFSCMISYILLNAISGTYMCILAIIRDIATIAIDEKINKENIKKYANLSVIIIFFISAIISAFYAYEGFCSLFSIFATLIYTYAIWQKNALVYKILGIPVSACWITYNIYVKSIFGVLLEVAMLISALTGFIHELKIKHN